MLQEKKVCNISVAYCDLSILKHVIGYVKKDLRSGSTTGAPVLLEDPVEYQFYTKGMVFRAPRPINTVNNDDSTDLQALEASCYHAAEHVLIEGTNPLTGGVGTSVGGISLSSGLVFVYDAAAGGSGAAAKLYEKAEEAMRRASAILESCPCSSKDGCPRCTYSYRCGNNNNSLNKAGGIEVYRLVFAGAATSIDGYKTGDPVSARSYRS
jgi:DEAD/DEAH box helicase domain-containing protein